ncbi:MAG: hypothetical protein ABL903_19830 [Methylococcales bacterium]
MNKGKSYVAFAVAALAVTAANKSAFSETLLDQFAVKSVSIAQVTDTGACLMFVTVPTGAAGADEVRVVGDSSGEVKLYTTVERANTAASTAKLTATATITLKRKEKIVALSTPSKELISLHRAIVREKLKFTASYAALETERALGQVTGWNVELIGSVKRTAYDLMVEKLASQDETKQNAIAKEAEYATLLTTAGINPATYLPI